MEDLTIQRLFNLEHSICKDYLIKYIYPWEVLEHISDFILQIGATLSLDKFNKIGNDIWIAKTAHVDPSASIHGPLIIDEFAQIRHCAFIRENAIVGKNAVVGNSTELKNCILFDAVEVPHFNYVGDSILGFHAHLGAGAITSNVKASRDEVVLKVDFNCKNKKINTNRKKIGAMLGDYVEIGCNSVLNPGTIIGKNSIIYPLSNVRGYVPEGSIFKDRNQIVPKN